jgi:transposase
VTRTSPSTTEVAPPSELRGDVLTMLSTLLEAGEREAVTELVAKLVARNGELERRLADLLGRGHKREGVSAAQLKLLLDGLPPETAAELERANAQLREASGLDVPPPAEPTTPPPPRQPRLRRPIPPQLRRVANPLKVPPAARACPICGAERECLGHDTTEVIDLIPAEVIVRLDQREKLVCRKCDELERAPTGDKVVAGGRLGSTLVGELLVDKYRDGLPLHRQKQRFARLGLPISVSTLADQVTWATDLLRPLWRAALAQVLGAAVMHLDSTSLPVLDRESVGGKKLGALWGYVGGETALYLYATTGKKVGQRAGELGPEDVLKLRRGYVVADAATLFDASFARPDLIECGCNMHGRRYFAKALDRGDGRAALPLAAFKKLFEVEAEVRDADAATRLAVRQERSAPVYAELVAWCTTHKPHEPPSSPLGAGLRYLLNHQLALQRFLTDGVIPIDNGAVERLHVRTALTRKNFLFAGSDAGGERAAIAYTILGSCALAGVNPVEYLGDVMPRLARRVRLRDVPDLLPERWKRQRPAGQPDVDVP